MTAWMAAGASGLLVALLVGALLGALPAARLLEPAPTSTWHDQLGVSRLQFWAVSAGCGLLTFLLVWLLSGLVVVAVVPAVIVAILPRAWFSHRRAAEVAALQEAWPDALRDLTASVASGMSLSRALEHLAGWGPPPIRAAFARYPVLVRNLGVVGALQSIREQLAHPTSDRVIEVLIVAQERGGTIVPQILTDLAAATTRDLRAGEEAETLALEQRINARVVFIIPWLVLVLLTMRPGPFRDFYSHPAGMLVVAVGALASLGGMWWVSHLGREPVEPRVFGEAA
jgi:tight adherence protein B